jgi:hypothetical protein
VEGLADLLAICNLNHQLLKDVLFGDEPGKIMKVFRRFQLVHPSQNQAFRLSLGIELRQDRLVMSRQSVYFGYCSSAFKNVDGIYERCHV